ncbi:unnamed protein product [Wuchereria bancrofti]|uniref:Uncharacterized protein n=1 Tax=Wuchereria bancrofti TaxID=6293 RepID=A0A3P7DR73_WUCBA|nr:unnamed protein product [Wuchereria bancrofti]
MTGERIPKQIEFGNNANGDERRAEIVDIENEMALLIQQGWLLIREYNTKMLKYLRLKMTYDMLRIKRSEQEMQRKYKRGSH